MSVKKKLKATGSIKCASRDSSPYIHIKTLERPKQKLKIVLYTWSLKGAEGGLKGAEEKEC